ncbi:hypothetical protein [Halocatena halophila]|uniref:hypothetical protein n=1 Tax=Halocatena halophila TaxID=2814576 RepID=UPI002ED1BA94
MSRRRSPRGRQRTSSNDSSQKLLQMMLVGAGVLFLLVGLLIGTGIPLPGSGSSGGGDAGSGEATTQQPSTPQDTPQQSTPTDEDDDDDTPEQEDTATQTPTPTPTPTAEPTPAAGSIQIVDAKDPDGNGYVSSFSIETPPVTESETIQGSDEVMFEIWVNDAKWTTDELDVTPGRGRLFEITDNMLTNENVVRGQAAVRVRANVIKGNGKTQTIEEWATTVKYEPQQ